MAEPITEESPDFAFKVDLRTPVGFTETFSTLLFRKARGHDIVQCGVPIKRNAGGDFGEFDIIADRMTAMMARLCGRTTAELTKMDANDWSFCANIIAMSFLPLSKGMEEGLAKT